MEDEVHEKYKLAGRIAADARDYGVSLIKSGVSFLDVANKVESKILSSGAGLAFPVNISVNELAAHYSPMHDDTLVFKKGDIVKLDVGAHIDGYIGDTAITLGVETHHYDDMIKASDDALDTAIGLMRAGADLSKVGNSVKETINSYGYKPIDNLSGHSLQKYKLHAGMTIPSVPGIFNKSKPKTGDVLAIEPFATNGAGHVISGGGSNIYLCTESLKSRLIRDNKTMMIFNKMKNRFKTLPFAQRWLVELFNNCDITLKKLKILGLIKHYPQLVEAKKGIVTQKEHTIIIDEDGCEITT